MAELQWQEYSRPRRTGQRGAPSWRARRTRRAAPPVRRRSLGHLLVATDGRTVQEVPLRLGRLIVGRTADNDVQIDSRFVSRHHCQVITTAHSCVIEDLNSTNGIYVKSNRVRRHYLNDGDVVLVGKHELIYVDERAARSRAPLTDTSPDAARAAQAAPASAEADEAAEATRTPPRPPPERFSALGASAGASAGLQRSSLPSSDSGSAYCERICAIIAPPQQHHDSAQHDHNPEQPRRPDSVRRGRRAGSWR